MRQSTTCIILLFCICFATAQIQQTRISPEVNDLQKRGWQVQHCCTSFDKQTVIFSAKMPNSEGFDLYEMHQQNNKWSTPIALKGINTQLDELWPSITSDEQQIYFVQRTPDEPNNKKAENQYSIMVSTRQGENWESGQTILISTGEDISPLILPDNQTLLFASKREIPGKKEHQFAIYFTRKVGKYDWYLPLLVHAPEEKGVHYYGMMLSGSSNQPTLQFTRQTCTRKDTAYSKDYLPLDTTFRSLPVLTVSGSVKDEITGHYLNNTINIYNAVTSKLLSRLHNEGQYTIALPVGTPYHIDITSPNYSHTYLEYDCSQLKKDSTETRHVTLAKSLQVHVNIFDAEMQTPLNDVQYRITSTKVNKTARATNGEASLDLPIGDIYTILFFKHGYSNSSLTINTKKDVLLTKSELDIDLMPGKAPIRIALYDSETKQTISGLIQLTNMVREERHTYITDSTYARQGDTYTIHASATGYIYSDTIVNIPYQTTPQAYLIGLRPLRQELVLQLHNILFEYNSASLKESSNSELDKVISLLKDNPNISIELSAHTDDRGTDTYNDRLSTKRGESVRNYLIKHGIQPERVTAIGYGKRHPLVPNDSEENRAINRRVEFKVTGM